MNEDKMLMWFAGLAIGALFLLLKWLNSKINRESQQLTESLHLLNESLKDEKKQTVWRVDEIYKRIDLHNGLHHDSRKEVDDKMTRLMTENQVKDFVDRSLKPIYRTLDSLNSNVEKINDSNITILSEVRLLIERDAHSRKDD